GLAGGGLVRGGLVGGGLVRGRGGGVVRGLLVGGELVLRRLELRLEGGDLLIRSGLRGRGFRLGLAQVGLARGEIGFSLLTATHEERSGGRACDEQFHVTPILQVMNPRRGDRTRTRS